jgi:hypothetical protein
MKFWFAPSGCPSFPPSVPPPPSTPCHRRRLRRCLYRLPRRRVIPTFSLDAADSAPVAPSPTPSRQPHFQPCLWPRRRWQCPRHRPRPPSPSPIPLPSTPPPSTSCRRTNPVADPARTQIHLFDLLLLVSGASLLGIVSFSSSSNLSCSWGHWFYRDWSVRNHLLIMLIWSVRIYLLRSAVLVLPICM